MDELAETPGPATAIVDRPAEDQLLGRPRHPNVEEPALLRQVMVALHGCVAYQARRQRKGVTTVARRESILDESHHEDHRKLEALGPVIGEHVDGVAGIDVGLGRGWVVTGIDQRVKLLDQEW